MEDNVSEPLGMSRSMARPHHEAVVLGRSVGYVPDEKGGWWAAQATMEEMMTPVTT